MNEPIRQKHRCLAGSEAYSAWLAGCTVCGRVSGGDVLTIKTTERTINRDTRTTRLSEYYCDEHLPDLSPPCEQEESRWLQFVYYSLKRIEQMTLP